MGHPGDIQAVLEEAVRTQAEETDLRMQAVEDRIQGGEKEHRIRMAKVRSLAEAQEDRQEDHREDHRGDHRDTAAGRSLLERDCSILDDYHSRDPGCKAGTESQKEVEHQEEEAQ